MIHTAMLVPYHWIPLFEHMCFSVNSDYSGETGLTDVEPLFKKNWFWS